MCITNCSACHGQMGEGGFGPAFKGNRNLAKTEHIVQTILNGSARMPPFGGQLSDAEIARVVTVIRTQWGDDPRTVNDGAGFAAASKLARSLIVEDSIMSLDIETKKSALLVMDCQRMLVDNYTADAEKFLATAAKVINTARGAGIKIIYIKVGFRSGYPEISDNNIMFTGVRDAGLFSGGGAAFDIAAGNQSR